MDASHIPVSCRVGEGERVNGKERNDIGNGNVQQYLFGWLLRNPNPGDMQMNGFYETLGPQIPFDGRWMQCIVVRFYKSFNEECQVRELKFGEYWDWN